MVFKIIMSFTIEIIDAKSERKITTLDRVPKTGTVGDVKDRIAKLYSRYYKGKIPNPKTETINGYF